MPHFTYTEFVNSSNVASISFDPDSEILEVQFLNGSVYNYSGVPFVIWAEFVDAPSKGKYHHAHIRGKYPFVKVR